MIYILMSESKYLQFVLANKIVIMYNAGNT